MTIHISKRVLSVLGAILLVALGAGAGVLITGSGDGGQDSTQPQNETASKSTHTDDDSAGVVQAPDPPDPDGKYQIECDYLLGDTLGEDYSFVASGTLRNTGNIGIVSKVTIQWEQIGTDPVVHEETVEIPVGETEELQVEIPVTGDQIDRIQAGSGRYCDSNVKIVDTFRGTGGGVSSDSGTFDLYTSESGGWSAEIPTADGWSDPIESEPTPGKLFRTEITGPDGAVLIIDSTPFEPPTFDAPSVSRETVRHPVFDSAEKIIFEGSENIASCEQGTCVDFLVTDLEGGGYAVLAGGPQDFDDLEAMAERVMLSLRPYDV